MGRTQKVTFFIAGLLVLLVVSKESDSKKDHVSI